MRRRIGALAVLALLVALGFPQPAHAVPTDELDANPAAWDGRAVTIQGELVGDFGRRGDVVWIQLNDDAYATVPLLERSDLAGGNQGIGVMVPTSVFDAALAGEHPGRYRWHGPVVRIVGVYRYHDPGRGGETYVEATSITLVQPGRPLSEPARGGVAALGLALALIGVGLHLRRRIADRR